MTRLEEALLRFVEIDYTEMLFSITEEEETQEFIINTIQDQLYNTGADGKGKSLGDYSFSTIRLKKKKGDPFDRVTLFDTGEFYDSFFIKPTKEGFIINADGLKEGGTNLLVKYGEDILLPNKDSIILIQNFYAKKIKEFLIQTFLS